MTISREQLKKLMQRPELTSLEDIEVQPESIEDDLAHKIESPDSENVNELSDDSEDQASDQYQADPEIAKLLMKLKSGQPADELDEVEVAPETIEDTSAPAELRKMAIDKIKQKYLGR